MKNKAVIFDLDGTLYDNKYLSFRMMAGGMRHLWKMVAEREGRKELAGRHYESPEKVYAALFGLMAEKLRCKAEEAGNWYHSFYMPLMVRVLEENRRARSWVRPLLEKLHSEGTVTAVFSDYDYADEKLKAIGLEPSLFDVVTDAFSEGGLKPCRESFLGVAGKLGMEPAEILVIGDREDTDGAGAKAAGMQFRILKEGKIEI